MIDSVFAAPDAPPRIPSRGGGLPPILPIETLNAFSARRFKDVAYLRERFRAALPNMKAADLAWLESRVRDHLDLFDQFLRVGSIEEIRPQITEVCREMASAGGNLENFVRVSAQIGLRTKLTLIELTPCEPELLTEALTRATEFDVTVFNEYARAQSEIWQEQQQKSARIHEDFFSNSVFPAMTGSADLRIVGVNPALVKFFAIDKDQVLGVPLGGFLRALLIPEAKVDLLVARIRTAGQLIQEELTVTSPRTGKQSVVLMSANFVLNEEGKRSGFQAIIEDVTQHRLLEYQLENEMAQMDAVFDSTPSGLSFVDSKRTIRRINREASRLLGYPPPEELEGMDLQNIQYIRDRAKLNFKDPAEYIQLLDEVYSDPRASRMGIFEMIHPARFIHYRVSPVQNPGNEPIGWLWIFNDVTDRMRAEALKNDLVHMIVHDLKNPLTAIQGGTAILRTMTDQTNSKIPQTLDLIHRNCRRMMDMIMNLLDIERLEEGKLELHRTEVGLAPLLRGVVEIQSFAGGERKLSCEMDHPLEDARISADADLIERVLTNLVGNAIKHTRPSGTIRLRARERRGGGLCIEVIDDGEGIPKDHHEKIFEKFGQAKMRSEGMKTDTGLGLTFCRLAVEAHGGHVRVESEPGHGATFRIELPASALLCEQAHGASSPEPATPARPA